jgi:hypothetical protein
MTPQEKAEELFVRFNKEGLHQISSVINRFIRKEMIKQCALIAVDEIINIGYWSFMESGGKQEQEYWHKVKQEIEKL